MQSRFLFQAAFSLLLCALIAGCGEQTSSAPAQTRQQEKKISASRPTDQRPTKAAGNHVLHGQAFLKLRRGSDDLAGMNVQLVNRTELEPRWAETRERQKTRYKAYLAQQLANEIMAVQGKIDETEKAKTYRTALVEQKKQELQKCRNERWSSFTYIDPITDQSANIEVTPAIHQMMANRLAELQRLLPRYDEIILGLKQDIVAKATGFKSIDATYYEKTADQVLEMTSSVLRGLPSEGAIAFRSTQEMISALDAATVDHTTVDRDGEFTFDGVAEGDYYIYAFHSDGEDKVTWLREVEWKAGKPRDIILSSQNTLNWERAIQLDRVDGLNDAIKSDLRSL